MYPCAECERLWREYAQATIKFGGVIKQQPAASSGESEGLCERLTAAAIQIAAAIQAREKARDAIRDHEAQLHLRNAA